jgi:hypothetical protein
VKRETGVGRRGRLKENYEKIIKRIQNLKKLHIIITTYVALKESHNKEQQKLNTDC